jgi:hypothetical protein
MSEVPLHIQRRLEQRWASRFTAPTVSKDVGTKPTPSKPAGRPAVRRCAPICEAFHVAEQDFQLSFVQPR